MTVKDPHYNCVWRIVDNYPQFSGNGERWFRLPERWWPKYANDLERLVCWVSIGYVP